MKYEAGRDMMERVGAIVLGGGRGTRLYPLTALRAKPAVPLLGRYRLVDIPLSLCINAGVKRIVVLTQFNSASLHRHINQTYQFDMFSQGSVEILAAEQTMASGDWYQGTADAVRKQLHHIRSDMGAEQYLILSGDHLYSMDYRLLLQTHLEKGADITVATLPVSSASAAGLGILNVSAQGRIKRFVEKPSTPEQLAELAVAPSQFDMHGIHTEHRHLASMGIYVFRASVMHDILDKHPDWIDFGKHVVPRSLRDYKVFAHLFDGYWEDIGTVRSYYEMHMKMVTPNLLFRLFDPKQVFYTHPRYLPGSRCQDVHITDSIICEGCRIRKAEIASAIIGVRSLVGSGAIIRKSIVMGADYLEDERDKTIPIHIGIGEGATISGAIIDKNARIGRNVVIRGSKRMRDGDGDGYAVRDGIVVVLKNAVIPDGTHIE